MKKGAPDPTSSRRLSHSEAFLVASLLSTAQSEIRLTPETSISGRTLSEHRLFGPRALYLDLKPRDAVESLLVALIVLTLDTAHDCFQETAKNRQNLALVEVNAKYAPKFTKVCNGLVATFDARQARQVEFLAADNVRIDVKGYPDDVIWNCDSVRLYFDLAPSTPTEAIQASLLVSAHNAASEALSQAKQHQSSRPARETYLKHALMCVDVVVNSLDAFVRSREKTAPKNRKKQRRAQIEQPTAGSAIKAPRANGHAGKAASRTNGRHP